MTLEKIVKGLRYADEQMLKGYTHIAETWEKKGGNVDHLAAAVGIPGYFLMTVSSIFLYPTPNTLFVPIIFPIATHTHDAVDNYVRIFEKEYNYRLDISGNKIPFDPTPDTLKIMSRITRFPTLVGGLGCAVKSVYEIMMHSGFAELPDHPLNYAALGLGLLAVASSQYLKDRDPKLLQKDPFWKKAYDWCTEKMYQRPPALQPIRVQA